MLELFQVSWEELTQKMPEIAEAGYTSLWLPPPAKGGSVFSVGYDLFDPFDLGDKNQRGTVATKYGTKAQLLKMVETAHRFGIRVYFDNIMNHRGFDVPGYNANTPTNLYPGLVPKDFHLQTISGGFYRNWPGVEDYGDQWKVQNESLSGLIDLATEPGAINVNFGNTLGSTTGKVSFIRQPANPDYYMDPSGPLLGGSWRPFRGTNGVPVNEDVNAYLIRAAMWTLYTTKCDGFRLDAVKHVPSGFFGDAVGKFNGYTGGIQAIYDWVHGYGTNFNSTYLETDDCRNSCFDTEAPRNDALLFGEHLGEPPSYGEYINSGMRLLNTSMRSIVDGYTAGGSGSGLDQRDIGAYGANQGVQFAQDQDHALCCVSHRELHNAYYFMHEGLPMIYSDGFNHAGPSGDPNTFPIVPLANYLGQFGDNKMPEICYLHHQLARGGTRSRWSDANIVAWERYDYREVAGDAFNDPNATVVFFALNNKTTFPGDVLFDDGLAQATDGYYACANGSPSRGFGMRVGFPPGSILTQLASSTPGVERTCPKLLVHNATTDLAQAQASANAANPVDRLIRVNTTPPPGGGAVELLIPSGGWVMYGYQWPEASRANLAARAFLFSQGGGPVPTMTVYRRDGVNGDGSFNPLYPFRMRGSIDPSGNVIGGTQVSNRTYAIDVPVVTNGPVDLAIRCDASAVNILARLDGGLDLNSQMGLGPASGLDRRDNRPGTATDVFLGYEQTALQFRNGPEKFAARNIARDNVTSLGAETYHYTVGGTNQVINGSGNGTNISTSAASWVYHDPDASNSVAGGSATATQRVPLSPTNGQPVELWLKVGYNFRTNRCFIYYTSDGTNPEGAFGVGKGSTKVVAGSWIAADSIDPSSDWFKATIPGAVQVNGFQVRYKAAFYQENIGTISDSDNAKLYGLTQFGVTNFNPVTVTTWLHNNRNTNDTTTGLSEGFHIVRARCFLPRSGKSSVFNTFAQTFYYDAQTPGGVIAFPPADGTVLTGPYTFVVRADSTVTGVEFNIADSDPGNDDAVTGQNNGNGQTNGTPVYAAATQLAPDGSLTQQYPNYPLEYRFTYNGIPGSGMATVTVRLKELTSSVLTNHVTTLVRTVNTMAPVQTLQIVSPATNGQLLVLSSNEVYVLQSCFSSSLTTTNAEFFSLYLNGQFQPRDQYVFRPTGCSAGQRALYFNWTNPPPGTNTIQLLFTNAVTLSDSRFFAVARPGDSDQDGMTDVAELIAGTNPFDPNSVLRITSLENGNHLVVWDSVSNVNYQVLATTNLNVPMAPISPIIPAAGLSTFYFDASPETVSKFYRVQVIR